jgi:Short C-terminal domain
VTSRNANAYALTGAAIASIWIAVVLASIFSPDLVSGSQHEHLPVVAFSDWLWGAIATGIVAIAALGGIRSEATDLAPWIVLAAGVAAIWLAVVLVSLFAPELVTGSDPTRVPLAAIGSPVVAVIATAFVCGFVRTAFWGESAPRPAAPGEPAAAERLRELAHLHDSGLITDEEFEAKRAEILRRL